MENSKSKNFKTITCTKLTQPNCYPCYFKDLQIREQILLLAAQKVIKILRKSQKVSDNFFKSEFSTKREQPNGSLLIGAESVVHPDKHILPLKSKISISFTVSI